MEAKYCKECGKEIINKRKKAYCSDDCFIESRKNADISTNDVSKQKRLEARAKWTHTKVEIGEVKHNNTIPLNKLELTNSIKTHLKLLLREYNLTTKKYIKITRIDNMARKMLVVVVTPKMIETLFYKRYDVYKNNFRLDCLRSAKTLAKIFNIVNEYYKKDKNAN